MGKLEFVITANIPDGASAEVEILEDIDEDGEFENTSRITLQDGRNKYIIDGMEGSRDNRYATRIHRQREDGSSNISVSNPRLSRPGKTETSFSDKSIFDKASQAKFFLDRIHESSPPESRYHLNGFLNAVYSIDEILQSKNVAFDDWAESFDDPAARKALHKFMMDARHSSTHLGIHSNSELRPALGHSSLIQFRSVGNDEGEATGIEGEVIEDQFTFVKVPDEILDDIESSDAWPEIEPIDAVIGDQQAEQQSVPVSVLCEIYYTQLAQWIRELEPALSFIDQDVEVVLDTD